ncbi:hypothetical protein A2U01_0002970, partial [Trifolium medium]|nr:hypothetical protein [Trifolium medium]
MKIKLNMLSPGVKHGIVGQENSTQVVTQECRSVIRDLQLM